MRNITRLAPLAALALLLTGCTHASEQTATVTGTQTSTASVPSNEDLIAGIRKDPRIAALVPEQIARKGRLTNGAAANYAPAEFMGPDGSTVVGYDVDYVRAIGKLMGLEVTTTNSAFPSLIPAVGTKYDLSASSFTVTAERQQQVTMTTYFRAGFAMAVRKGNPAGVSPDELCGHSVAVQTGTAQETAAQERSKKCVVAGKDRIDVLSYANQADAATNVAGGKADVAFADSMIINYAVKQSHGQLENLGSMTDAALFGVVTSKKDPQLAKAVQAATQKLIDDGTMRKLLATWGNEDGMVKTSQINPES